MPGGSFVGGGGSLVSGAFNRAVGAGSSYQPLEAEPRSAAEEEILRLREDYARYHSRRLRKHKEDESFYSLEYFVATPEQNRDPLRAPTAHQIVQELMAHISAESPVITEMSRSRDQSKMKMASKRTSWLSGYWDKAELTLIMRYLIWFEAVRGVHCLRLLHDKAWWPAKPVPPVEPREPANLVDGPTAQFEQYVEDLAVYQDERDTYKEEIAEWREFTEENLPIKVQALDPQYVLWEPTDDPRSCIVTWERTVDDIKAGRDYDEELLDYLRMFQPGTKVTWCEWWDEYKYAYWIEPVSGTGSGGGAPYWVQRPRKHNYGFFPFFIDGPWVNPLSEPDKKYPSIYFSIKSFLMYESTLVAQMAHIFRKLGWPILVVNTPNAHSDANKPVFDLRPGAQNFLDEQEHASYLELGQGTMSLLERIISGTDEYIQDGTGLRDVMRGTPKGKSGYQQAQVAAQARVAFVPVEQCLQRTLKKASRSILKLIRLVGEKVTVMSAESSRDSETAIGPKDVEEVGMIVVSMKTVMPIDEAQKNKANHDLADWGWITEVEAARMSGIGNAEEKHEAAEVEKFNQLPPIQMAKAIKHMRENDPETWQVIQEFNLLPQLLAQITPPPPQGGGGPVGGKGGIPAPGGKPTPPAAPGSPEQASLIQRQAAQGMTVPKQLPAGPAE